MKKYIVSLSEAEREECDNLVRKGVGKAKSITHARILLMADESGGNGRPDEEIATWFGVNVRTVERCKTLETTRQERSLLGKLLIASHLEKWLAIGA